MNKAARGNWMMYTFAAMLAAAAATGLCRGDDTQYLAQDSWLPGQNVESWNQGLMENKSWVRNDSSPAQISMLDFSGRLRLADTGEYSPTVAYSSTYIGLGTSTALLPRQLNNEAMSIGIPLGEIGSWGVGIALGAGYAGNSPFNDPNGIYGMARILAGRDISKDTQLAVGLSYNGNGSFFPDAPIPIVEIRHEQPGLEWTVGFPYESLRWQALPRLAFKVDYQPVDTGTAEADYTVMSWLHAYTEFVADSWAFHVSSYQSDQRLFMTQCRVQAGFKLITLGRHVHINIGGGYAFNQAFSQGYDGWDEQPVAQIANAAYIALNLTGKF